MDVIDNIEIINYQPESKDKYTDNWYMYYTTVYYKNCKIHRDCDLPAIVEDSKGECFPSLHPDTVKNIIKHWYCDGILKKKEYIYDEGYSYDYFDDKGNRYDYFDEKTGCYYQQYELNLGLVSLKQV